MRNKLSIIFAFGLVLHEIAHYIVASKLAKEAEFLLPSETALAADILRSDWVNTVMAFILGMDSIKVTYGSKFGVRADWEGCHAEYIILYALAPVLWLPVAILITYVSVTTYIALGASVGISAGGIFAALILANIFIVWTQFAYAAVPSFRDLSIVKEELKFIISQK